MLQLLDQALCQLPAAEIAAAVRKLDDEDLANIVRSHDGVRRFLLLVSVEQLDGQRKGKKTNGKPRRKGLKPSERRALSKSNSGAKAAPSAKPGKGEGRAARMRIVRASILAEVKAAGDEGARSSAIAETLQMTRDAVGFQLRKLKSQGKVRMTGTRNHARWFAA